MCLYSFRFRAHTKMYFSGRFISEKAVPVLQGRRSDILFGPKNQTNPFRHPAFVAPHIGTACFRILGPHTGPPNSMIVDPVSMDSLL